MKDIVWLKPDGGEMTDAEWSQSYARSLGVYFSGEGLTEKDGRGRPLSDASFLVLFNAHHDGIQFQLPTFTPEARWLVVMDTSHEDGLRARTRDRSRRRLCPAGSCSRVAAAAEG